jgi:hypothetical protein
LYVNQINISFLIAIHYCNSGNNTVQPYLGN